MMYIFLLIDKKDAVIGKYFPDIVASHVIHTNNAAEKIEILKELYNKRKGEIIFIEDTASTIQLADEDNSIDYIYGIHISSFLV